MEDDEAIQQEIIYYPGCTLHTWARSLGDSAVAGFAALGLDFKELPKWTCCQAVFPLAKDNVMGLIPAARTLIQAQEQGDILTTLCSFCFNVLRRTNYAIQTDEIIRKKVNAYLEADYHGDMPVLHPLEILRDQLGWEELRERVAKPLKGLKVAPYYGCQMIRPPKEMQFDDPEDPQILDDFLESIGCDVIEFPLKVECCGSYQSIAGVDPVQHQVNLIISNARNNGAQALALSCPICFYNLDTIQRKILDKHLGAEPMPVFYFTELLAMALGIEDGTCDFSCHKVDPSPMLEIVEVRFQ